MKKKPILLFCLILILVIGGIIYFTTGSSIKNGEISKRSKEFIKSQSKTGGSNWNLVNLEKDKNSTKNTRFDVDGCFSFIMIYRLTNQRIEGKCEGYYAFDNPKGSINVYLRSVNNTLSTDNIEGVSLRRLNKDIYKESAKIINGREFLIFTKTEGGAQANAFYLHEGNKAFVFNLSLNSVDDLKRDLEKMLETLEFSK